MKFRDVFSSWHTQAFIARWRDRVSYPMMVPAHFRNCFAWMLPKLGIGVVLELRSGQRYFVRPGTTDLGVVNDIVMKNPYFGPGYLELPPDAVVVDVGANNGTFAIEVARRCPAGQVYAVEPVAEHARLIAINILLNEVSNIKVIQLALGSQEGETEIFVNGGLSSCYWGKEGTKKETVRLSTLTKLIDEYQIESIDLLKLDCEGAEWDILPKCQDILPRVKQICMEYHLAQGWTVESLTAWLSDRGFEVNHKGGEWTGLLWATRPKQSVALSSPGTYKV